MHGIFAFLRPPDEAVVHKRRAGQGTTLLPSLNTGAVGAGLLTAAIKPGCNQGAGPAESPCGEQNRESSPTSRNPSNTCTALPPPLLRLRLLLSSRSSDSAEAVIRRSLWRCGHCTSCISRPFSIASRSSRFRFKSAWASASVVSFARASAVLAASRSRMRFWRSFWASNKI